MKQWNKKLIYKTFDNAIRENFKIECERKNGKTHIYVEGKALTIAIGLAAMEKAILDEIYMDEDSFELIKVITGYKKEER